MASADALIAAVAAGLPGGNTLTRGDVEAAVRAAFERGASDRTSDHARHLRASATGSGSADVTGEPSSTRTAKS